MMNAFFDNIGHVQQGEQSDFQSGQPPTDEQPETQDYEEEDAVMAFPQWCNAVTTQVNGKAIRAMVDPGATHNYISSIEVERLGLTLEKRCGRVKVINSAAQPVAGIARSVLIKGMLNSVADALSRRTELDQLALTAMNAIVRGDIPAAINIGKKIKKALTKDSVAQQLLKLVESDKTRPFCQEDVC
ncbi:hypothetical protein RJ640_018292 [Escallonia rubra]|uniref:Uncharacterized protein n=1 Tax=Escallonia rubra TaxID=112253 RepID=A0AA88RLY6_9ASTE|nr:hypothetical protein RJ640_018292 [Escallonia rubra]